MSWILGADHLPGHVDPDKFAVRWESGDLTYADLKRRSLSLAAALLESGAKAGDRIAFHLFNRGEIFELYFACAFAGLILVPINFRLTSREVAFILDDCQPRVIVTEPELKPVAADAIRQLSACNPLLVELGEEACGAQWEAWATKTDVAPEFGHCPTHLILYTSGTTGRPKGVTMEHSGILWFAFQQVAFYRGIGSDTVTLLTGPMYNTAAINEQSIPTLLAGGTVAIMPSRGWRPEAMVKRIADWQVTHSLFYPSMIEPMVAAMNEHDMSMPTMRFVLTGGENCPPATMRKFMDVWPHVELCIGYGSTESGCVTLITGSEIARHPGSVGRVSGGQSLLIVDEDLLPLKPHQIGRVMTAGPSVTPGYWNAPELTNAAIHNGWLDTGDLGRVDEAGYLYIEGRTRDLIISKGQNIYPAELENVLIEHPDVLDCAVFGVPDEESGETPCACVVLNDNADADADSLMVYLRERLASFKKPKYIVFVASIPRNASKKVLKAELAGQVSEMGIVRA